MLVVEQTQEEEAERGWSSEKIQSEVKKLDKRVVLFRWLATLFCISYITITSAQIIVNDMEGRRDGDLF